MAVLRPFKAVRPPKELAHKIASRPYDVLNSEEARVEVEGNEMSLLHIIKPEIDLPADVDHYAQEVYDKAHSNFELFQNKQWLVQDEKASIYIYAQTWRGKTQYGIVGCTAVEDYLNGVIKKHELTRKVKEEDRMKHVRITDANMEPVFFSYPANAELDSMVAEFVKNNQAVYSFNCGDEVDHDFWVISDDKMIQRIVELFDAMPALYVADGHHRTAAAALVGNEKKQNNPNHKGDEEYNFFMSVNFPDNKLTIIDYNRVVTDLNGLFDEKFIDKLKQHFVVEAKGTEIYKPAKLHEFSLYLGGEWYKMNAIDGSYNDNDPIGVLDVTILSNHVLAEMLDIQDLRTSDRIDFIGGIRGLEELKRRVDNGEMKAAFALYPVSMKQLIDIADTGNIMPPKTTWFEPKLRSGLAIHKLS